MDPLASRRESITPCFWGVGCSEWLPSQHMAYQRRTKRHCTMESPKKYCLRQGNITYPKSCQEQVSLEVKKLNWPHQPSFPISSEDPSTHQKDQMHPNRRTFHEIPGQYSSKLSGSSRISTVFSCHNQGEPTEMGQLYATLDWSRVQYTICYPKSPRRELVKN